MSISDCGSSKPVDIEPNTMISEAVSKHSWACLPAAAILCLAICSKLLGFCSIRIRLRFLSDNISNFQELTVSRSHIVIVDRTKIARDEFLKLFCLLTKLMALSEHFLK